MTDENTRLPSDSVVEAARKAYENLPRPQDFNWACFAEGYKQAAQTRDDVEADLAACDRAIERMGWPEIQAFMAEPAQSPYEDAGGHLLRKIKALFGIKPDSLETYREAAERLVAEARAQNGGSNKALAAQPRDDGWELHALEDAKVEEELARQRIAKAGGLAGELLIWRDWATYNIGEPYRDMPFDRSNSETQRFVDTTRWVVLAETLTRAATALSQEDEQPELDAIIHGSMDKDFDRKAALSQGDEQPSTWWMIERHDLEPSPQYFRSEGPGKHGWVADWKRGTRFDTENAARNETNCDPLLLVVEHGYIADPQTDGQPDIPDMTEAECATAYRDLRKRANDAGFATVGEWIDEQPDTPDYSDEISSAQMNAIRSLAGGRNAQPDTGPSVEAMVETYQQTHEVARELGYPSLTEALEHLAELKEQPDTDGLADWREVSFMQLWSNYCDLKGELADARDALRTDRKALLEEAAKIDFEDLLSRAQLKMRAFQRRLRGQIITNHDSIDWWIFHETIETIRALAEGQGNDPSRST